MPRLEPQSILTGIYDGIPWKFYLAGFVPEIVKTTAVACLPLFKKKVVIVRNLKRGWEFPGGHADPNEQLVQTVKREVEEEACCIVDEPVLFGYQEFNYLFQLKNYPYPKAYIAYFYAAINKIRDFKPKFSDEIVEVGLFSIGEAEKLLTNWYQKRLLFTVGNIIDDKTIQR